MPPSTEQQLAVLFREAGSAHHRAFAATHGEDPDWPSWYAAYLAPQLEKVIGRAIDVTSLAADLRAVDVEQRRAAGAESWSEYYASWFVRRLSR